MKALIVIDGHLIKTPDGKVWSSRIYNYEFFSRYLSVFENIIIAVRMKNLDNNKGFPNLCSGRNIEFFPIEEYRGPKEYAFKYFSIRKNINKAIKDCDCAIFRIPSSLGFQFCDIYKKLKKPYAVEVVIDPWDFAAPGMLKTPFRPFVRLIWTIKLKKICMKANGVSYVTKEALQKRYPCRSFKDKNPLFFHSYYSSIDLNDDFFGNARKYEYNSNIKIIHIANNIGNFVKGHKELIESLAILKKDNIIPCVTFVGDGDLIPYFKNYAENLNVGNQCLFIGKLSNSNEIKKELLKNDIFVFPSHAEGLPRVLIEAMAVGLPCISTNINGIPELLSDDYLVPVGDVKLLANKIKEFVNNPDKMSKESINNIKKAKEYSSNELKKRRDVFYEKLRKIS